MAVTTGVGLVGTGTSAVDVTAMSGVSEERTETSTGEVTAMSDTRGWRQALVT